MKRLLSTLATIWRLSIPYFRSEDRWPGRILLGAVIGIELSVVAINVILNQWYNRFYNALQAFDRGQIFRQLGVFFILGSLGITLSVYAVYMQQMLQIRWRRWLTRRYLNAWGWSRHFIALEFRSSSILIPFMRGSKACDGGVSLRAPRVDI